MTEKQKNEESQAAGMLVVQKPGLGTDSKLKETAMHAFILLILFFGLLIDPLPMSFFNQEAIKRGLVESQTGIVFGCYDLARFLFAPFCSRVVKKISVKTAFMLGAGSVGATCIAFGLVGYSHSAVVMFSMSMLMRLLCGVGGALLKVSGASIMMKSKFYPQATIFSWLEMAHSMSIMIGVMLGGALYELLGYVPLFVLIGGLVMMSCIPASFIVPNICEVNNSDDKGFTDLMKIPGMVIVFLSCMVGELSLTGRDTMYSKWAVDTFDIDIKTWTLLYAPVPLAFLLGNIPAVWAVNRGYVYSSLISNWMIYIPTMLFMCPAPFILPLYNYKPCLPLTVFLTGLGAFSLPFLYVALFQVVLNMSTEHGHDPESLQTYARIQGMFTSSWALGSMLGSPTSGLITETLSFPWSTTFLAGASLVVLIAFLLMLLIQKLSKHKTNSGHIKEKDGETQSLLKSGD